jgi:predicted O-methyltransferase YrrM
MSYKNLLPELSLADIWASKKIAKDWSKVEQTLEDLGIPDETGGVNPGDRRAIYYLMRHFKPKRVLETGTHIGASTIYTAAALEPDASMTTVDILDVNSEQKKNWLKYKTERSPAAMVRSLGLDNKVEFIVGKSLDYLPSAGMFDFIFLDGDHSAPTVHNEIPLALEHLNPGGAILLHDYFPNNEPIWKTHPQKMIRGPYLAVEQLRSEGLRIRALPLGELPWPTTLNSSLTSLAILVRD